MKQIKALVIFLLRIAAAEKIILMLFVLGALVLMTVNVGYSPAMETLMSRGDFQQAFTAKELPFMVASFFSMVCMAVVSSSGYWWILKEFFKQESIVFFLMKPVSSYAVSTAIILSGFLLMGAFAVFMELVFSGIAFLHTRAFFPYYTAVNVAVLWYAGCLIFLFFCYFYRVWKNPLSIIFSAMLAASGFVQGRIAEIPAEGLFMQVSVWLAAHLVPPLDRFFTIAALKYPGRASAVIGETLPLFLILLIIVWKTTAGVYESKRKR